MIFTGETPPSSGGYISRTYPVTSIHLASKPSNMSVIVELSSARSSMRMLDRLNTDTDKHKIRYYIHLLRTAIDVIAVTSAKDQAVVHVR